MRPEKADLVMGEIPKVIRNKNGKMVPNPEYPEDGFCKSGHMVSGARFFAISGSILPSDRHGVYCDACMAVANQLAANRK